MELFRPPAAIRLPAWLSTAVMLPETFGNSTERTSRVTSPCTKAVSRAIETEGLLRSANCSASGRVSVGAGVLVWATKERDSEIKINTLRRITLALLLALPCDERADTPPER